MNITEKYGMRIIFDQFGNDVQENYIDESEIILINKFEECLLILKKEEKDLYTMIELGSNQAYYSLLFKSILKNTKQIMLEPYDIHMQRGVKQFEHNNFDGIFIKNSIGSKWVEQPTITFDSEPTSVDKLLIDYNIDMLDVLHSDIDGSELDMLNGCVNSLRDKRIEYIFVLTHSLILHTQCKDFISKYDYSILLECADETVGSDGLIVIKKN